MRDIRIEKLTLNIGVGEGGDRLNNAKVILERLSGRKAVVTKTHKRSTFASKNRPIGVKVTIRGKAAEEMLHRLLKVVEGIKASSFDNSGNFSFGVPEYIDIPDLDYDPKIGMYGLDVTVTLERRGYRVKKRKTPSRLGKTHIISKEDAIEFAKKFGITILEEEK